jgi:hypothetical protein
MTETTRTDSVGSADPVALSQAHWVKARASTNSTGCVEIARLPDGQVALRNSRFPDEQAHVFTSHEWACFLDGARNGEFD